MRELISSVSHQHLLLPDEVSGYAFDPERSWWATVVAEESTNLVINPSFERINDAGFVDEYAAGGTFTEIGEANIIVIYPAIGATAGRRMAQLVSAPGTGTFDYIAGIAVTPGEYTFSLDLYSTDAPVVMTMAVITTGGVVVASRTHRLDRSAWQRLHLTYKETATATRRLRVSLTVAAGEDAVSLYTDAWQFERKGYPTTYLDGDMLGFADSMPSSSFYWHGQPHGSASTRRASTGAGGRIESWSERAGFMTTSIVGLLMAPVEQRLQTLGNGRRIHLGMVAQARDFTVTGKIFGRNYGDLMRKHIGLQHLLQASNTRGNDQMLLRYQALDSQGQPIGDLLELVCVYRTGLQGEISNFYQAALGMQFTAVQPYPTQSYESSVALSLVEELENNMIVYKDVHGEFFNLGTGVTLGGVVTQVGFLSDGRMVAFGNYTDLAGSGAEFGAIWDGTTWVEIADTNAAITDIDDGFRLGYPLTVGTAGGTVEVYDALAETWEVLGGGDWLGPINSIARDANGDLWIGGTFETSETGFTTYNHVAHWDAALEEWQVMGDGLTDPDDLSPDPTRVNKVLVPNDGWVYFAGNFMQGESGAVTTVALNNVARWDIENQVYAGMGAGFDAAPNDMIMGKDGFIYAVGPFSESGAGTLEMRGFARWNGYAWQEVFPLVKPGGVYGADGLFQDEEGVFWFYNVIDSVDPEDDMFDVPGLGLVPFFGWRDGIFYPPYLGNATIRHMALGPGNQVIHATFPYGAGDPLVAAPAMNRINYSGSADAPFVLHVEGPGLFNQVRNYSTEGGIYGRNTFLLSDSETVIVRADTQRQLLYSNQRRNLYGRLLGGASNLAALRLIPGENFVSVLILDSVEDNTDAWLTWKNRYQGIAERAG